MSDDLAATGFELELDGKTYQCGHVTSADRAALREHIRRERIKAIQDACKGDTLNARAETIARASAIPVGDMELFSFMATEEGMIYLLWRGLRAKNPSFTLDHARNLLTPDLLAIYSREQYVVSGFVMGDDSSLATVQSDYDKEAAIIMRYYGVGPQDIQMFSPKDTRKLCELVKVVQEALGEDKKL